MSATSTLVLAAATVALVVAQFDDKGTGLQNQKDVDDAIRLVALTTPAAAGSAEADGVLVRECGATAFKTFQAMKSCNDAKGNDLGDNVNADCKCVNALATEVAKLQVGITRKFIESFVNPLQGMQELTNANNEFASGFNNNANCVNQINNRLGAALGNAARAAITAQCGNQAAQLTAAAAAAQKEARALVRAEELKAAGNTADADADLQFFQIAVIDNGLNTKNANLDRQFSDLVQSDARQEKIIEALTLNGLSFTVQQIKAKSWASYKSSFNSTQIDQALLDVLQGDKQLQGLLQEVAPKIAADPIFANAIVDLNAKAATPTAKALALSAVFKKADDRVPKLAAANQQATVLLIGSIDNDAAAKALDATVKTIMPVETVTSIAVDRNNAGKKELLIASVSEGGLRSVINIDNEFGIACVQGGLTCTVVDDVSRNTFDAVQKAADTPNPTPHVPPPHPIYDSPAPIVDDSAASLVLAAAVSVVSALALFF